jgi:trimethylamine:corrinoid methyltransferase-like protein
MTDQNVVARRREQRRERQTAAATQSLAQPVNNLPVYELASAEALHQINDTSLLILEEIGIDFYDEEALAVLARPRCCGEGIDGLL